MVRMADLNFKVIKEAHLQDIKDYGPRTKPSPQHIHRHWLLKEHEQLVAKLQMVIPYLNHTDECASHLDFRGVRDPCNCGLEDVQTRLSD